jgi:hypothetical protein
MIETDTSRERLELAINDAKASGLTWVHVDDLRAILARAEKAEAERDTAWNDAVQEDFTVLVREGILEAEKAMRKFPQPNYVISKFAEESGEVVKAAIHCAEGRETPENLLGEMRQTIAMIYRLWAEGDQVHGLHPLRKGEPT